MKSKAKKKVKSRLKHSQPMNFKGTYTSGICHAYKSASACSTRTKFCKQKLEAYGKDTTQTHIKGLQKTKSIDNDSILMFQDYLQKEVVRTGKSKVFFSGKKMLSDDLNLMNKCENGFLVNLHDNEHIEIVDTISGLSCINTTTGDIVFILLPRKEVLKMKGCAKYVESLEKVESCKSVGYGKRGSERSIIFEDYSKGNYVNIGLAANRSGKGFVYKVPKDFQTTEHSRAIEKWTNQVRELVLKYIPTHLFSRLKHVCNNIGLAHTANLGISKNKNTRIKGNSTANQKPDNRQILNFIPSLAISRDVALSLHTDEDAFFSVAAVYSPNDIVTRNTSSGTRTQFDLTSKILKYFTFQCGILVGMQSGDLLIFNPQVAHCISTNTDQCGDGGVITTSHYFKSNIIGLNDNDIPFRIETDRKV